MIYYYYNPQTGRIKEFNTNGQKIIDYLKPILQNDEYTIQSHGDLYTITSPFTQNIIYIIPGGLFK